MQVCPRCKVIIRDGELVRAVITAQFLRDELDSHILAVEDEERVEHLACEPEAWEIRLVKFTKRRVRWLKQFIFPARWAA